MEHIFNDGLRNQVPYRATRTFPTSNSSHSAQRRFEPSWNRDSTDCGYDSTPPSISSKHTSYEVSYTRDEITCAVDSIGDAPPPHDLQLCAMIFTEDNAFASMLLDKTYYNPKPNESDHSPYQFSNSYSRNSDYRAKTGLGRGRGFRVEPSSFELEPSWPPSSKVPFLRSRLTSDKTDIPFPQERIFSEQSKSQSVSEAEPVSPISSPTDWQYFPGEELCDHNDSQTTKQDNWNDDVNQLPKSAIDQSALTIEGELEVEEFEVAEFETNEKIAEDPFKIRSDVMPTPVEKQVSDFSTRSEERVAELWSQNGESQNISFLNPSEFHHTTDCDMETNNFGNPNNDLYTNSTSSLPQDPRHLWYYIDPKSNVQGPFLSEQMDGWYARQYFPPTLPVWRECDSEAFKLSNLLNISENCSEPFSVGAERLLISKDFSPVEDNINHFQSGGTFEESDSPHAPNLDPTGTDQTFKDLVVGSASKVSKNESGSKNQFDGNSFKSNKEDEKFKMAQTQSSPGEEAQQHTSPTSSDLTVSKKNEPVANDRKVISPQPPVNMWLQGPPNISGHVTNSTSINSNQFTIKDTVLHDGLNRALSNSASEGLANPHLKSTIQHKPPIGTTEEKMKRNITSPLGNYSGDNPTKGDSKVGWTKVGPDKKQKKKPKKESNTNSIQTLIDIQPVTSPNRELPSSPNFKLDELDSFSMRKGKRSQNIKIPFQPSQVSVVNFSEILSEQSKEESIVKLILREESPRSIDFQFDRQLSASKQRNVISPWGSAPKETIPSFLDIESEQKTNVETSETSNEMSRFRESQSTQQQQQSGIPSWARIMKSSEETMLPISTKKASRRNSSTLSIKNTELPSPNDEVFAPTHQDSNQLTQLSKSKQLNSSNDSENVIRLTEDGLMLSKACYEWVTSEISNLNNTIDPPTTVHLLQGFTSLFEITQLGSELLGTSERTNVMCRRIWEDLNAGKKLSTKQKKSQADEWVKVAKKPLKNSNKKRSKCSKSPVD